MQVTVTLVSSKPAQSANDIPSDLVTFDCGPLLYK